MITDLIIGGIALLLIFILFVCTIMVVSEKEQKKLEKMREDMKSSEMPIRKPNLSKEAVIEIVNWCTKTQFEKKKTLVWDLNRVKYYNFEEELKELSEEAYKCLGKGVIQDFNYYFAPDYLSKYITNLTELLLLGDMKTRVN